MMKKGILALSALLLVAVSCRQHHLNENEIASLAQSAGIPQMQLCYFDGKTVQSCSICKESDHVTSLQTYSYDIKGPQSSKKMVFQAASLGKPVFSYIVMRLVDEGLIELDRPVAEYTDIERFEDKEMAARITPRMVLSHTTGLYNWAYSPTREEWRSSSIGFHFPVDQCFGYSGEAYAFLQRAVEAVTGKTLDAVAREYVFEPFGMELSSYGWRSEYDELAVCGYDREGASHGRWEWIQPNCAYTLRTTCEEYMSFIANAIVKGAFLSEQTRSEWLTPRVRAVRFMGAERPCDADVYWCLGMGVKVEYGADGEVVPRQYWHWGDNDYWKSLYVVDLAEGTAMAYFTNSAAGHDISDSMCETVLGRSFGLQAWIDSTDDL